MELAAGATLEGRYVVRGLLGEGGMARVYVARDTKLEVDVAVKVLSVPRASLRARLLREGRVQAALRHPNVLPVTDIVTVDGLPGLVMERVYGGSLDVLMQAHPLDAVEAEHLARGVLEALRAAHEHGVVHRDLKPANVLITRAGDALVPKVADFGLVKLLGDLDAHGTRSGVAMGTPRYMAPEQVRNARDVDARADLWSFGALLYELLCGEGPFDGEDTYEVYRAVAEGTYPEPVGVAPRLRRVIEACLSVDRDDRPASAAEVVALLDADDGPPPVRWRTETLAALERIVAASSDQVELSAPSLASAEASAATWGGSLAEGAAPTVERPASFEEVQPAPTRRSRMGVLALLSVVLLAGALASALLVTVVGSAWLLGGRPEAGVFTTERAPAVEAHGHQAMLDRAWLAYRSAETLEALDIVERAVREGTEDPAFFLLGAAAELEQRDNSGYHRYLRVGLPHAVEGRSAVDDLLRVLGAHLEDRSVDWWVPQLGEHLERHPDDQLARLLLGTQNNIHPAVGLGEERYLDTMARDPDAPLPAIQWLWWVWANEPDRALSVADDIVARHPTHAVVLGARAAVRLDRGDDRGALADARACLSEDPELHWCRISGVAAALRVGDEATYQEILAPMQQPGVPERAWASNQNLAVEVMKAGRLHEADALWTRIHAAAAHQSDGMALQAAVTHLMALPPAPARPPGRLEPALQRAKDWIIRAEVSARLAAWARDQVPLYEGLSAAERGELQLALEILDDLGSDPRAALLQVAIDAARQDLDALAAPAPVGAWCADPTRAWHLLEADRPAPALALLRDADPSACGSQVGPALHHGLLALALHHTGDDTGAAEAMEDFRGAWSRPDADLPLVRRLADAGLWTTVAPPSRSR